MINEHHSIELFGRPLFTWIDLNTPMEGELPIPSEACFSYFVHGDNQVLSKQHAVSAIAHQAFLSVCGFTLGKKLMEQEAGRVNSITIHFHPDVLKKIYKDTKPPYWTEIEAPVTKVIVQMAATNLVQNYIESLKNLFENKNALTEDILILKLQEIILLLMQTDDQPQITNTIRSLFSERTFTFKETIETYLLTPATLENLATLTNMSLSTFKREFKRIYDDTPQRYIINKRIEKVAFLLQTSDVSISSIGYDCGFSTPAHLTRVFKAKYKKTPTEYRLDFSDK